MSSNSSPVVQPKSPHITLPLKNTWLGTGLLFLLQSIWILKPDAAVEKQMQPELPMVACHYCFWDPCDLQVWFLVTPGASAPMSCLFPWLCKASSFLKPAGTVPAEVQPVTASSHNVTRVTFEPIALKLKLKGEKREIIWNKNITKWCVKTKSPYHSLVPSPDLGSMALTMQQAIESWAAWQLTTLLTGINLFHHYFVLLIRRVGSSICSIYWWLIYCLMW